MSKNPPDDRDAEVLPETVAARLLARASELDVARRSGSAVTDLRRAAAEAGISAAAFDGALAELQRAEDRSVPETRDRPGRRARLWALTVTAALIVATGAVAVARGTAPAGEAVAAGPAMVEQAILLRCLSPGEAAELVRPLLGLRANKVVYSPTHAARVLTIRATPAQLQEVKALLDQHEAVGSSACATSPAAGTP